MPTIITARPEDRALLASNPSAVRGRSMPAAFALPVDAAGRSPLTMLWLQRDKRTVAPPLTAATGQTFVWINGALE